MKDKRHRDREHGPTWSGESIVGGNGPFGGVRRLFWSVPGVQPRATKRNVLVVLGYLFVFGLLLALLGVAGVELLPPSGPW